MVMRLAGGALLLLGLLLMALGAVGLLSIQLVLSDSGAVTLLLAGLVCVALGVLIWRGSRLATLVALVLLVCLLVIQGATLAGAPAREPEDFWRLAITGALAALLGLAAARPSRVGR